MKFGLFGGARQGGDAGQASDSHPFHEFIDYVCEAETLGFHSVFLVEHHFTGLGQVSASLGLLTFLAARTTRMRLGTAVVVLPWHNPVLLIEQAATLDLLSKGRFDFGIGRGYRGNEFEGFCIPIEEADERYEEAIAIIRKAWSGKTGASKGRFSHQGKRWKFDNIVVEPAPVQHPHPPLWAGAASERSIRKAAEEGFNLLLAQHGAPEVIGKQVATYREAVTGLGRKFDPMSVGVTRALHITHTAAEREEAHRLRQEFLAGNRVLARPSGGAPAAGFLKDFSSAEEMRKATEADALIGPPEEIVARLEQYRAAGVEYMLLTDVACSREALRTFAREVMPAFAE